MTSGIPKVHELRFFFADAVPPMVSQAALKASIQVELEIIPRADDNLSMSFYLPHFS